MSNVISFPFLSHTVTSIQRTRREYLDIAKNTLDLDDYENLLLSIMDPQYYMESDDLIRQATDDYYDLPNSRMEC